MGGLDRARELLDYELQQALRDHYSDGFAVNSCPGCQQAYEPRLEIETIDRIMEERDARTDSPKPE